MNERLLFVAAGMAQSPAIREARNLGHYVIAVDGDATAPGFHEANESHTIDILDDKEIVRVVKKTRASGIVSVCCDAAMEAVSRACENLGFPGVPLDVVKMSRSKLLQREAMLAEGLLVPSFRAVSNVTDALHAWDEFKSPACVLKPVDASGSRGVSYVDDRNKVPSSFEMAKQNSKSGMVMVESFMPGIEYSVEAWTIGSDVQVLATSEKARTQPPYLLDRQVHFPDMLPAANRNIMISHAVRAIQACGFRDCPVHLECIYSPDGPMIVELAARGAGFKVFTEMLPRVTGLSTTNLSIQACLGMKPKLTDIECRSAATLAFIDPVPGPFRAANGIEEARKLSGVSEVVIYVKPGQRLHNLRSGADRAGHVLVYQSDAVKCREIARQALAMIQIEVL